MRIVTVSVTGPGSSTVGKLIRNALVDAVGLNVELVDVTEADTVKSSILIDRADQLVEDNVKVVVEVGLGETRGNA